MLEELTQEEEIDLFLKSYKEKYNLAEEELREFRDYYDKKVERIVASAAEYDLLPVIKYFIENGGIHIFL